MVYNAGIKRFNFVLISLQIRNIALIDDLEIPFGPGLTVLTGETGAGKSIIVGALNLVLGDRANTSIIRQQSDEAEVEALFEIESTGQVQKQLIEMDLANDDAMLVVRRIITRKGKNRVYLNGRLATLADLKRLISPLIDISSQHAHTNLLRVPGHREVLDQFGSVQPQLAIYQDIFNQWCDAQRDYCELQAVSQSRNEREDLLRFQLNELDTVDPKPQEDETLMAECAVLRHASVLRDAAEYAESTLYARSGSVSELLGQVETQLRNASTKDPALSSLADRMDAARIEIEDVAMEARSYRSRVDVDPRRLEQTEERLASIRRLLRKHGPTMTDVIERRSAINTEIQQLDDLDDRLAKLQYIAAQARELLDDEAKKLTASRKKAAETVTQLAEDQLADLGMVHSRLEVCIKPSEDPTSTGNDHVEFLLSSNPGESPLPLAKIASGGELSRIMLALKHVLASSDTVDLYVFDEVDTGVGGGIAERIGVKLRETANHRQVLCITHLPQVACHAHQHIQVSKDLVDGRTVTQVKPLSSTERLEEVARLLAGVEITAQARAHAAELLKIASQ